MCGTFFISHSNNHWNAIFFSLSCLNAWMFLKKEHFNPIHIDRWRKRCFQHLLKNERKRRINELSFSFHFHNRRRSILSRALPTCSLLGKHLFSPSCTLLNGLLPVTSGSSSSRNWTRGTPCGLSWFSSCLYTRVPPMKALGCGTDGAAHGTEINKNHYFFCFIISIFLHAFYKPKQLHTSAMLVITASTSKWSWNNLRFTPKLQFPPPHWNAHA